MITSNQATETVDPQETSRMRAVPSPPARIQRAAEAASRLIPFALIVYLALDKGGFAIDAYSQIGLLAWWVVAVGLVFGTLSGRGIGGAGWVALGLLAAFTAWTALGISWSPSSERSFVEAARVAVYLGVFVAAMLLGGDRLRATLEAVGAACVVIAAVALLSRLHPSWFPANELADVLPSVQSRLAYPLNYWNALAGLVAIGLPLVAWAAAGARQTAVRAVAAAALPIMALTIYYTYSRGGLLATTAALIAFLALAPRRIAVLGALLPAAIGSAIVIWAASRRGDLAAGLTDQSALSQGNEMLAIVVIVVLLIGLISAAMTLAASRGRLPAAPVVSRRLALGLLVGVVVAGGVAFVALDGPHHVSDSWTTFKQPADPGDTSSRLSSASGNGRWQYWSAAVHANATAPLIGIGPGTFVLWWNQHRDISGFVRDAHSLFVETLGELGIIGLALIAGFVGFLLIGGVRKCLTAIDDGRRLELAAATASMVAFTVAAGLDWLWELAVIPIAFLLVAAATLLSAEETPAQAEPTRRHEPTRRRRILAVAATGTAAIASIAVMVGIGIPMLGSERVAASQREVREGDLASALASAESAADLQPYAASPRVQEALILELDDSLSKASAQARLATDRESTNWETWFVLSRVLAQRGKDGAALRAFHTAQSLDPLSPLLNPEG